MPTFLEYTKNGKSHQKEFNSYYLAIVEKNKLFAKGISSKVVVTNEQPDDDNIHVIDRKIRTIYTKKDRQQLKAIARNYNLEDF